MSVNIRLPNVTAPTESGKMAQVQSYMFQLVEQLNYELNNLQKSVDDSAQEIIRRTSSSGQVSEEKAVLNFNSIKALIIKSAEIVQAYFNEFKTRFDGVYMAESDFGTYMEQYWMDLDINPHGITQLFTDIEQIQTSIEGFESFLRTTNAYIKTGRLGPDPEDNTHDLYGMAVGQTETVNDVETFNQYAWFTSGGVYFFLPGYTDPVAKLTETTLSVRSAIIAGNLTLGQYRLETSNGLAFKWVGG